MCLDWAANLALSSSFPVNDIDWIYIRIEGGIRSTGGDQDRISNRDGGMLSMFIDRENDTPNSDPISIRFYQLIVILWISGGLTNYHFSNPIRIQ